MAQQADLPDVRAQAPGRVTGGRDGQTGGMDDERDDTQGLQSATENVTGDGGEGAEPAEADGLADPREGFDSHNRSATTTGEGGGEG